MITSYLVEHYEHVTEKSYEELIESFETEVGNAADGRLIDTMKTVNNAREWEALCNTLFGPSGFMYVLAFDHGRWLKFYGRAVKARQYTYGNPLLAYTIMQHDLRVGSDVPLRVMIYEAPDGRAVMAYDLPSSVMRRLGNRAIDEAAKKLDEKLLAFAKKLTGVAA